MKNREKLENKLDLILNKEVSNTKLVSSRFDDLKKEGLNESDFSRFLHLRESVTAASDVILYYLCKVYFNEDIQGYFLSKEIKQYEKVSFSEPQLVLPISVRAIQISDQQWVGKITAQELLLWRNAQIINYNENAQRTMKHIVRHGREFFQISLNNKAVNSVMELMESGVFIPNTLTFNIPEDVSIHYDENSFQLDLTLGDMKPKLDILDGYHRYIAISKLLSKNPEFDYNMEIRFVQFTESEAQQFIWQEDQKTKMSKSQSDAMNQNKLANQITQRINDNGACDLYHHITANGTINKGYFAQMIDRLYCKNVAKKNELTVQKETVNNLTKYLNIIVEQDPSLLEKKWDRIYTYCALFLSDKETKKSEIDALYKKVKADEKYIFNSQEISKSDISKLTRLYREDKFYV